MAAERTVVAWEVLSEKDRKTCERFRLSNAVIALCGSDTKNVDVSKFRMQSLQSDDCYFLEDVEGTALGMALCELYRNSPGHAKDCVEALLNGGVYSNSGKACLKSKAFITLLLNAPDPLKEWLRRTSGFTAPESVDHTPTQARPGECYGLPLTTRVTKLRDVRPGCSVAEFGQVLNQWELVELEFGFAALAIHGGFASDCKLIYTVAPLDTAYLARYLRVVLGVTKVISDRDSTSASVHSVYCNGRHCNAVVCETDEFIKRVAEDDHVADCMVDAGLTINIDRNPKAAECMTKKYVDTVVSVELMCKAVETSLQCLPRELATLVADKAVTDKEEAMKKWAGSEYVTRALRLRFVTSAPNKDIADTPARDGGGDAAAAAAAEVQRRVISPPSTPESAVAPRGTGKLLRSTPFARAKGCRRLAYESRPPPPAGGIYGAAAAAAAAYAH